MKKVKIDTFVYHVPLYTAYVGRVETSGLKIKRTELTRFGQGFCHAEYGHGSKRILKFFQFGGLQPTSMLAA